MRTIPISEELAAAMRAAATERELYDRLVIRPAIIKAAKDLEARILGQGHEGLTIEWQEDVQR